MDQARALVTRASKLRASGALGQAERQYLAALRIEPLYVPAADGLARLHLARRDTRSAVLWARKAVKLRPGAAGLHVLLGDALAQSGDRAGAMNEWRRAIALNPRLREAQKRLAAPPRNNRSPSPAPPPRAPTPRRR
jgi:Flp pilus assembly protein TadD